MVMRAIIFLKHAAAGALAFSAAVSQAFAIAPGDATFTLVSGNDATGQQDLVADSNKCPAEGPTAMYVAGDITNTSGSTLSDVTATLTGLTLAGGQAATITIGALTPGESYFVAWSVTYSCTIGTTGSATISISDDAGGSLARNISWTVRTSQSANAGGQVTAATLGPGAIVGQVIAIDVTYDFGNISVGNEFFLQPSGSTAFDAACFQLVGSEITSTNISALPLGAIDQLYFVSPVKQAGNGYTASVRYDFRYLCAGATTVARPFSSQTSGGSIKYSGNFDGTGSLQISFPGATNPLTISKTVDRQLFTGGAGGNVIYTVTLANPSAFDTTLDAISDTLPAGVSFVAIDPASDVTVANSSSTPANGATGTISFNANVGTTYNLPAGGSVSLIYSALIPDVAADYINSVSGVIGLESVGPATTLVVVAAGEALNVTKTVSVYDPSLTGLYAVPGNDVVYTIRVENLTALPIDANTIIIEDQFPDEVEFFNDDFSGAGDAVAYSDAGLGGVNCCSGVVEYSDTAIGAPVYGYAASTGYDPAIRHIRISPTGALAGSSGAINWFEVSFRGRIK